MFSLALSLALLATRPAAAQEEEAAVEPGEARIERVEPAKVAIQRRKFQMAHEFSLWLGTMPLDAFQKGYTASLSYTLHLNEYFAWEVLHGSFALLASTNLRDELIDTFAIPPEDFAAPKLMFTTGVEFTPFYGKQAVLNDAIVHQGILGGLYAGMVFGDRQNFADTLQDFRPAVGLGLGYRLFANKTWSFRLDFRDFLTLRDAKRANEKVTVENILLIGAAVSLNLWRDDA